MFNLPSLFKATDDYSQKWQKKFLLAQKAQLVCLILAAIGGSTSWVISQDFRLSAFITMIALLCAVFVKIYLLANTPEKKWYNGRAAAESIKTLSWKFVAGGAPFEKTKTKTAVEQLFLSRVGEILATVPTLNEPTVGVRQLTKSMKDERNKSFTDRKAYYITNRVEDQMTWYSKKSSFNSRRSSLWSGLLISLEVLAIILAILRFAGVIELDLAGVTATIVAAGISWIQSKQYETLAQSYSVTAQELARVGSLLDTTNERDWPINVEQAEEAISREHTLWLASHK